MSPRYEPTMREMAGRYLLTLGHSSRSRFTAGEVQTMLEQFGEAMLGHEKRENVRLRALLEDFRLFVGKPALAFDPEGRGEKDDVRG